MVKVGDLFEITLSGNRTAIGHYIYWDKKNGPFIQVFNYLAEKKDMRVDDAIKKPYMFPPIITGLKAAVREGLWPIIGRMPVTNFVYPRFLSAHWNHKTGEVKNWFLYDGNNFISIGDTLPDKYKQLEYLVVWSPYDVVYRIETGVIPFPYGDMINNNKFIPVSTDH